MENKDQVIEAVRKECVENVKQYLSENAIGFENEVYLEMKKKLDELGIDWSPFENPVVQ